MGGAMNVSGYLQALLDWLSDNKDAISSLGTVLGLLLFIFAVIQYRRAEHWKQSEFLAKLHKEFMEQPSTQRAMTMLDYNGREINFGSEDKLDIEKINYTILMDALRRHERDGTFTRLEA